jgi:hypothetical protein
MINTRIYGLTEGSIFTAPDYSAKEVDKNNEQRVEEDIGNPAIFPNPWSIHSGMLYNLPIKHSPEVNYGFCTHR